MPELEVRKTTNTLFNALEEDVDQRISRATGIDAYDDLFRLVTGSQLSRRDSLKPIWEGMYVLFQFRNVLAHGREISAARLSAYWIKEPWLDQFTGGYKRAEEYLVKRKLISKGFWDSDSEHLFFSDDVADHFWCLSSDFVREVQASVDAEDRAVFAEVLLNGASSPDDMAAEQSPAGDVLKAAPEE